MFSREKKHTVSPLHIKKITHPTPYYLSPPTALLSPYTTVSISEQTHQVFIPDSLRHPPMTTVDRDDAALECFEDEEAFIQLLTDPDLPRCPSFKVCGGEQCQACARHVTQVYVDYKRTWLENKELIASRFTEKWELETCRKLHILEILLRLTTCSMAPILRARRVWFRRVVWLTFLSSIPLVCELPLCLKSVKTQFHMLSNLTVHFVDQLRRQYPTSSRILGPRGD